MQKVTVKTVTELTAKAKRVFVDMNAAEAAVYRDVKLGCYYAWLLGKVFNAVKGELEHGAFEAWRHSAFPKLTDTKAQRCMALFNRNAKASELTLLSDRSVAQFFEKLDADSVRKYQLGYVPDKDKPELKGRDNAGSLNNVTFERPRGSVKCANEIYKLIQQLESVEVNVDVSQWRQDLADPFAQIATRVFADRIVTLEDGRKAVVIE